MKPPLGVRAVSGWRPPTQEEWDETQRIVKLARQLGADVIQDPSRVFHRAPGDANITKDCMEWWHEGRTLTLYSDGTFVASWGKSILNEMADGEYTLELAPKLWEWLRMGGPFPEGSMD